MRLPLPTHILRRRVQLSQLDSTALPIVLTWAALTGFSVVFVALASVLKKYPILSFVLSPLRDFRLCRMKHTHMVRTTNDTLAATTKPLHPGA